MARRRLLTADQWATFLALPKDERELVRHYTLSRDDLDIVVTKRAAHNRLGCAVLLCYLRHPGRAPDLDEAPPPQLLAFVARQVGADPVDYVEYRRRSQTQREQIGAIMARTGHCAFDRAAFHDLSNWLVSIAQVNRDPLALAAALVDELRRRQILLPSAAVLEMILHQARGRAESLVHRALTGALEPDGDQALEALLEPYGEAPIAMLAWLRQAPQSPAARNLVAIVERLTALRDLGVDRSYRARIPEAAFERLAAEGVRMTAQHIRDLARPRRLAVLMATAIRMEADLTDSALAMFDKLMGTLSRRAENCTAEKTLNSVRDTQAQLRTLVTACRTLIDALQTGADAFEAIDLSVGWSRFVTCVADVEALSRPEATDARTELLTRYPTIRAFAPALLNAFQFKGGTTVSPLLRAIDIIRAMYTGGKRVLPVKPPTSFIRRSWRPFVMPGGEIERKAYELCALSELRDRLRAGDVWVEGSRQFRDFETCLAPRPTFEILRAEGALPVAVGADGGVHLSDRRQVLVQRIADVGAAAAAGTLVDVDLSSGELKVTPISGPPC